MVAHPIPTYLFLTNVYWPHWLDAFQSELNIALGVGIWVLQPLVTFLFHYLPALPPSTMNEFEKEWFWSLLWVCVCFALTGDHGHSISPVTPSELLVALHNIDCSDDEVLMKAAIKCSFRVVWYLIFWLFAFFRQLPIFVFLRRVYTHRKC